MMARSSLVREREAHFVWLLCLIFLSGQTSGPCLGEQLKWWPFREGNEALLDELGEIALAHGGLEGLLRAIQAAADLSGRSSKGNYGKLRQSLIANVDGAHVQRTTGPDRYN